MKGNLVTHYTHEDYEQPFIIFVKMEGGYPYVAHVQHAGRSVDSEPDIFAQTFADLALERHADIQGARELLEGYQEGAIVDLLEFVQAIADRENNDGA